MRIRLFALMLLLFVAGTMAVEAQTTKPAIRWVGTLPATCNPLNAQQVLVYKYTATTGVYYCSASNTWTAIGGGGGAFTGGAVTTPITFANGTAAAPSMAFTSDADGSGTGIFRSAADSLGFSTNGTERWTFNSAGQIVITQGSLTGSSSPFASHTATWNNAGTTFTNLLSNVTDTASNAASLLMDFQIGGASRFKVDKAGNVTIPTGTGLYFGASIAFEHNAGSGYVGINRGSAAGTTRIYGGPVYLGNNLLTLVDGATGKVSFDATMTAGGTTGARTINKPSGSVNFAAAATSLVVTNSVVTANSVVLCQVMTNDSTMKSVSCVAAAGSFTIHANAAATGETKVGFVVFND